MSKTNNKDLLILSLISIIFTFGVLLRLYNINYDDFWIDEIFSFWVSDPKVSIMESYQRNNASEGFPFLFNFFMKILYKIFGYETYLARYVLALFGIFSIISVGYLAKILKNNNSFVLVIFLMSFNVFLIRYSQEARAYSLVFFLTSLTLIFFCKTILSYNKGNISYRNLILFTIFQIITILSYPLIIIIFFSIILYSLVFFNKIKEINKPLLFSLLTILFFLFLYLPFYFNNTFADSSWIQHPNLKFYSNFYFSKFFGSRILGLIHITLLLFLIIKFKKNFIKYSDLKLLFLLIFILSYILPIIYGYIFQPILHQRYIIFIIIPIILLLSLLIFEIENIKLKFFFIFVLTISTIGNNFTETNFKQFYNKRPYFKPEISNAFNIIEQSKHKSFSFDKDLYYSKNIPPKAIRNYLFKLLEEKKWKIQHIDPELRINIKYLWVFCTKKLIGLKCINPKYKEQFKILDSKNIKNINIKLIKFE